MKKTIKLLIIFFAIVMFGINYKVQAATVDFQASSSTVNVGDEITITANLTAAQWDLKIKLNGTILTQSSELENYESNLTKTITTKYKTTEKGTLEFVLEGDITDVNQENNTVSKRIQVTVNEKITPPTQPETPPTNPTIPPATVTKSSEARLKNFGIKPNDFSGFKRDKFEYTTEVPNNVGEVEIYAQKLHDKATVEGAGKVQLKEGNNEFSIKVTAEDGTTTKIYKLTIKRRTSAEDDAANGEARLKTLGIKKYDFEGFNKDKTQYSVQIPENIKEIEVYATAIDSKAQITGTGMITLEEGESTLEIVVIAVNGTKKTYSINVIRIDAEEKEETKKPIEEKFGLSKLTIAGVTLNPKFDVETYEYKIDIKEVITSLQIIAEANDEDATVEIIGNENFQDGENVITILVKNDKTEEIATYQIIANVSVEVEQVPMSWLKPSTWGKEEIIKIILIIVLIILIISAILLKINISKEDKKAKKVDLPGADELDKAIAEHQELAEEEANKEEITEKDEVIERYEAQANYLEEIAKSRLEEDNLNTVVEEFDIKPRRKGKHF